MTIVDRDRRRILIQELEDLPTLSVIISELVEMVDNDKYSAKDLSGLIAKDVSISSSVLKLVNSAFYQLPRKITSIHQTVVILGFTIVKSIALGSAIFKPVGIEDRKILRHRKLLWTHSLGVAVIAKIIANKVNYEDIEEAFVAGLLHDVGKVVIDVLFKEDLQHVLEMVEDGNSTFSDAEKLIMGIDHAEAGGILLKKWQIPESVTSAVSYHHSFSEAPTEHIELTSIVHLANTICERIKLGSIGNKMMPSISKAAMNAINFSHTKMDETKLEIKAIREQIELFEI